MILTALPAPETPPPPAFCAEMTRPEAIALMVLMGQLSQQHLVALFPMLSESGVNKLSRLLDGTWYDPLHEAFAEPYEDETIASSEITRRLLSDIGVI